MAKVTIKEGKAPRKRAPQQKKIWWRVLLAFIGGFLTFPLLVVGAGAIVGTVLSLKQVVGMTGADPDQVLSEKYQQMTLLQAVMDVANKDFQTLKDIEDITPLAEEYVYASLENTLKTYGVMTLPDGSFAIDWETLASKNLMGDGDGSVIAYLMNALTDDTYLSVVLNQLNKAENPSDPTPATDKLSKIFQFFLFGVIDNGDGTYTLNKNDPYSIANLLYDQNLLNNIVNSYISVGDLLPEGTELTGILAQLAPWHVSDFTSDNVTNTLMNIKLNEILPADMYNPSSTSYNKLLVALDELFPEQGGIKVSNLLETDTLMNIKIKSVITGDNAIVDAIDELYGGATLNDLMNTDVLFNLTLADLGINLGDSAILDAIKDVPINKLSSSLDSITLGDVMGSSAGSLFNKPAIKSLTISDMASFQDTIKSTLTLNDVMAINSSSPQILQTLKDAVLESDSMLPVVKEGLYKIPFCNLKAPDGKMFKEWAINTADGEKIAPGEKYPLTSDITLVALWQDEPTSSYTVSFDKGAGTGEMAAVSDVSGEYIIPDCKFKANEGYQFKHWEDAEHNIYQYKDKINVTSNLALTAIYEATGEKVKVQMDAGAHGKGTMLSKRVYGRYVLPKCYFDADTGYYFSHWELSENGGESYTSLKGQNTVRIVPGENKNYILRAVWGVIPTGNHTVSFDFNGGSVKKDIQTAMKDLQLKDMISIPADSNILKALGEAYPLLADDPGDGKKSLNETLPDLQLKDILDIYAGDTYVVDEAVVDATSYSSEEAAKGALYTKEATAEGGYDASKTYYSYDETLNEYFVNESVVDSASHDAAIDNLCYFAKATSYAGGSYYMVNHAKSEAILVALKDAYPMLGTSVGAKKNLNDSIKDLLFCDVFSNEGAEGVMKALWDTYEGGRFPITEISKAISGSEEINPGTGKKYPGVALIDFLGGSLYEEESKCSANGWDYHRYLDVDEDGEPEEYTRIAASWWYLLTSSSEDAYYEAHPEYKYYYLKSGSSYRLTPDSMSGLVGNMTHHITTESVYSLMDAGFLVLGGDTRSKLDGVLDYGTSSAKVLGDMNVTDFVSNVLNRLNEVYYRIKYDGNGGSGTMDDTVGTLTTIATTKVPACTFSAPTGKAFSGWHIYNIYTAKYYSLSGAASDTPTLVVPDGYTPFGFSIIGGGYKLIAQWADL